MSLAHQLDMEPTRRRALFLVMPPQLGLLEGFSSALVALAAHVRQQLQAIELEILDLSAVVPAGLTGAVRPIIEAAARGLEVFVGVTTTTASYQSALRTAQAIRMQAPKVVIIFGGHHASAQAELVLSRHPFLVNCVIVGEGERSLAELLCHWPDCSRIPGLAYFSGGTFRQNAAARLLQTRELDEVPVTFDGLGLVGTPGKFGHATYVSARGCPLQCAFCSVSNQAIRAKSVTAVVRDIQELVAKGFHRIAIEDNFFAHSPRRTRELCTALAQLRNEGLNFSWDCQTRVESMASSETIRVMAAAGCEAVYLGVEAVSAGALLYLGKTRQPERYLNVLESVVLPGLLASPIETYVNLQMGLPGENFEDLLAAVSFFERIGRMAAYQNKYITVFPQLHVIYPGTTHFLQGIGNGLFPDDVLESFTAWEAKEEPVLRWLGEHFAHGTGGLPIGILREEPLRHTIFEINAESVVRISWALTALSRVPGVEVFKYGQHLVCTNAQPWTALDCAKGEHP